MAHCSGSATSDPAKFAGDFRGIAMQRILVRTFGVLLLVLAVLTAFVWIRSAAALRQTWRIDEPALVLPTEAEALERGRHLAVTRGCTDCHGADLGGNVIMEEPPIGRLAGPNLTGGKGGVVAGFNSTDWERAIRHGVKSDGHGLLFMPTTDFASLTDADAAALIAWLIQQPPVDREQAPSYVGPIGRALFAFGQLPLIGARSIDQQAPHRAELTIAPTAEYGHYLAQACTGCHGKHFSGGAVPGVPPSFPKAANLTPDAASGLGSWNKTDFYRALREGRKPDGSALDPFMPWKALRQLSDTELDALWAYLRTVPSLAAGQH